jgi:glycine hydroxymethyltransferase
MLTEEETTPKPLQTELQENLEEDLFEVHDPAILGAARSLLDSCATPEQMQQAVLAAVKRNEKWRGQECINLLAPEAPTSPTVRALLSSEVGTRAAEGHIGAVNRWFAGTKHIDEIESLCVELLKKLFKANYADHRLCASMIGNLAVYTALTEPGDVIMSLPQPVGGHSSNRPDGPAGVRGLKIVDIPFDQNELVVDLETFRKVAPLVRPKVVALGASMTLFPFPLKEMSEIVAEWGGKLFFDGAHQLGLVAGGQFQDPLREGAAVTTGSAGKTFSGPQSGVMVWNDPAITESLTTAVFPILAATHQVNRVAALAASAAELLAFGQTYMAQIVANPASISRTVEDLRKRWPDQRIGLHLHNTRGLGLANALAGLELGIADFESSVGGLGGCPFAPRAVGNICTEDFVHMVHDMGLETGIDLDALIDVARFTQGILGRTLPGMVMKAGKASDLHDKNAARVKVD